MSELQEVFYDFIVHNKAHTNSLGVPDPIIHVYKFYLLILN
jgi:hypothetical protein